MATCNECILSPMCLARGGFMAQGEICQNFKNKDDFAEVKHGEWFVDGNITECSNCHKEYVTARGMLQLKEFDYCPHCGAKMDVRSDT